MPLPRPGELSLTEAEVARRYDSLRMLAVEITAAGSVEDVCSGIASWLGSALGNLQAVVALRGEEDGRPDVFGPDGAPMEDGDAMVADLRTALLAGPPPEVDDRPGQFPGLVFEQTVEGMRCHVADPLDATGRVSGAVVQLLGPGGHIEEPTRARVVLAMCGSALQRAWAIERAGQLAAVTNAMLGDASIGFAFLDRDLRFVHVNERLAEANGLSVADHLGRSVRDVLPDLAPTVEPLMKRVLRRGRPLPKVEVAGEIAARPGVGRVREERYFPVTDAAGSVIGVGAIVEDVTARKQATEELEQRYVEEREIANRLREGLQPVLVAPPKGYALASRYRAGAGMRVGGDWYDLVALGGDRLAVVIGDIVGHGIDAALGMVRVRHSLVGLAHALETPGAVLEALDATVQGDEERLVGTLFYGVLRSSSGAVTFASAGHPPALLITAAGRVTPISAGRSTPIGIAAASRPEAAVALEPGDSLVLYTDGVLERRGESADRGIDRLVEAARGVVEDVDELADRLIARVADPDHDDDLALVVLQRLPG